MRRLLVPPLLLACAAAALAAARWDAATSIAGRLADRLIDERSAEGGPRLTRSEPLDAIAEERAREIAARPPGSRLAGRSPIETHLAMEKVGRFRRALEFVHLQRHASDPVGEVLRDRPHRSPFWETLRRGRRAGRVGAGAAWSDDGWLVLVALLLEAPRSEGELRALATAVREAVDRARERHGSAPLAPDARLARVAAQHAAAMAAAGKLAHRLPGGGGPAERVRAAGIGYRRVAENLLAISDGDGVAGRALAGWLDSPGHRKNLLDRRFTHTGVGVAAAADGTLYFAQLFLLPPADSQPR